MCQIWESIIKDQFIEYLVNRRLINKVQLAFINNHSTATYLLECNNDWIVSVCSMNHADDILFDFSKAFISAVTSKLVIVIHLLTLHSRSESDESAERAVFLGGHPSKYWPPSKMCAVWCVQYSVPLCQVFVIAARLGNWLLLLQLVIATDITGHGNFL
jgi:hypothetical protein